MIKVEYLSVGRGAVYKTDPVMVDLILQLDMQLVQKPVPKFKVF